MNQTVTILGIGHVLPDPTPTLLDLPAGLGDPCLAYQCTPSPGKDILPASALRRLGRTQRMAMTAIHLALETAGLDIESRENVAVCVGTAWGELGHTYAFLENMITHDELNPKPASFVNSVHNAIAGQIAITLKCKGENHTCIHSAISFENSLAHAITLLNSGRASIVVACGVDELNGYIVAAEQHLNTAPLAPQNPPGEGAVAVVLGRASHGPRIRSVHTRPFQLAQFNASNRDNEVRFIQQALIKADVSVMDIECMVCNFSGNSQQANAYKDIAQQLSIQAKRTIPIARYDHTTGEYRTASAAGIAFAAQTIQEAAWSLSLKVVGSSPVEVPSTFLTYSLSSTGFQSACVVSR